MHHINLNVKYKNGDVFTIYPLGDFHIGHKSCRLDKLQANIEEIKKDDTAFVILLGDLAECIVPGDKKRFRYDQIHDAFVQNVGTLPTAYLDYLKELLEPIKSKIIASHNGNHEDSLLKYYYRDINAELCGYLGVPYVPGHLFTKINFSYETGGHQKSIIINSAHGHKSGYKTGSKVNFMEDLPSWIDANLILRGHSHSLFCNKKIKIGPNSRNTKIVQKEILVAHCGSYLEAYKSGSKTYAEDSDMAPTTIGILKIFIEFGNDEYTLSYLIR